MHHFDSLFTIHAQFTNKSSSGFGTSCHYFTGPSDRPTDILSSGFYVSMNICRLWIYIHISLLRVRRYWCQQEIQNLRPDRIANRWPISSCSVFAEHFFTMRAQKASSKFTGRAMIPMFSDTSTGTSCDAESSSFCLARVGGNTPQLLFLLCCPTCGMSGQFLFISCSLRE